MGWQVLAPTGPKQVSPIVLSQALLVAPQGAPAAAAEAVHTPVWVGLAALAPTQVEKVWQGRSLVQVASPVASRSRQSMSPADSVLHSCPGAQPELSQGAPSAGWSAHTPHVAFLVPAQNREAHCPANAQVAPLASCPAGAQSGGGLALLSNRSMHAHVEYPLAHFSSWSGVLLVPIAATLFVQAIFTLSRHVVMSP
jgi:hypothetical protein